MVDTFNPVTKLPDEACKQFIDWVRILADELATAGRPLASEDITYRLLFGLPEEYRQLRTAIISNRTDDHVLSTIQIIPAILSEERHLLNTSRTCVSSTSASSGPAPGAAYTTSSQLSPTFDQSVLPQQYQARTRSPRRDRGRRDRSRSPHNDWNRRDHSRTSHNRDHSRSPRNDQRRRYNREDRSPSCTVVLDTTIGKKTVF